MNRENINDWAQVVMGVAILALIGMGIVCVFWLAVSSLWTAGGIIERIVALLLALIPLSAFVAGITSIGRKA